MAQNFKTSGSGTIMAGEYEAISISGSAVVDGDISFDTMKVSGRCHTNSSHTLTGKQLRISGSLKLSGALEVEEFHVSGSCRLEDCEVHGTSMHVSGSLTTNCNIKVKELRASGRVKSTGAKIYADSIYIPGSFSNDDEVNADEIELYGASSLNDVFGDHIVARITPKKNTIFSFNIFSSERAHHIKNIECTTLEAQALHCGSISAETIELSENCVIDHIQCDGTLIYDKTCKIGTVEGTCTQTLKED